MELARDVENRGADTERRMRGNCVQVALAVGVQAAIDGALRAMTECERNRLVCKLELPRYMDVKPDGFDWGIFIHNVAMNIAA